MDLLFLLDEADRTKLYFNALPPRGVGIRTPA
jgi:hypothetical protein